jgi:serine/threonine-protein kinase
MGARYRITDALGRATRVFRGEAESSDGIRDVAIARVVENAPGSREFANMVVDDLRWSARLHHANIVELVDVAETPDGAYYVVTEYIDGCNLDTLVARRPRLSLSQALHIVVRCCQGLAHAHARGVCHRRVSPRTVLLGTDGAVKLAEFGVARAGGVKGEFGYLSPEAASGLDVDHRTDVFAIGIVLWELLTGRRLFAGPTDYQTIELVRAARIPPLEDPPLDAIIQKALARDLNGRVQSPDELCDAVAEYVVARNLEVAPGELATLVREVQRDVAAEAPPRAVDTATRDAVSRMVSVLAP